MTRDAISQPAASRFGNVRPLPVGLMADGRIALRLRLMPAPAGSAAGKTSESLRLEPADCLASMGAGGDQKAQTCDSDEYKFWIKG